MQLVTASENAKHVAALLGLSMTAKLKTDTLETLSYPYACKKTTWT
jgi:hypothetical protein